MEVKKPLAGLRVAVTRPQEQSADLMELIRTAGGEALLYPLIDIVLRHQVADFIEAISKLPDIYVFTSVNGVRAFVEGNLTLESPVVPNLPTFCVGKATAQAASHAGFAVEPTPKVFAAENLIERIGKAREGRKRVLFVRGNLVEPDFANALSHMGFEVMEVIGYETVTTPFAVRLMEDVHQRKVDAITFYSGSAVKAFFDVSIKRMEWDGVLAAVGPKTAKVIREYGYEPQVVAETASTNSLMDSLIHYFISHTTYR